MKPGSTNPYTAGLPILESSGFFGRNAETRQFFSIFSKCQLSLKNVLGLRRAGKTSFLKHISNPEIVAAHLGNRASSVTIAYVNLETIESVEEFFSDSMASILGATPRLSGEAYSCKNIRAFRF